VRFLVFDKGKAVKNFSLVGAYMFGTDGIAIRKAQVSFKDGFIVCDKPNLGTAGLALLWPVEGFGRILLPTTCLPERSRPYVLNVEIARAKMMQIINKREDWSFFAELESFKNVAREAQDLWIGAVQNIADAPLAAKLADEAMKRAVLFSEQIAIRQSVALFESRCENHSFGKGCLGGEVDFRRIGEPDYIKSLVELFNFVMVPINWGQIETESGNYDFSRIDFCVEQLKKKRVALGAGPILCFSKDKLPKWLLDGTVSFEKVRESAYKFVTELVSQYGQDIHIWRVISGLNAFNFFGFNFEQVLEMTRAANMAVKAASDRALKIIEVSNPWGEYYAEEPNTIPPIVYVDMVIQSGISFDAFGVPFQFGKNQNGLHVRDLMHISAVLDNFSGAGKPLYIPSVEVPSSFADSKQAEGAGIWHWKWDELCQAQWLEQFYRIAFSKGFVEAVIYSSLADHKDSVIAGSGLLTDKLQPRKSFEVIKNLRGFIFKH
jgi:hypothetical protein